MKKIVAVFEIDEKKLGNIKDRVDLMDAFESFIAPLTEVGICLTDDCFEDEDPHNMF